MSKNETRASVLIRTWGLLAGGLAVAVLWLVFRLSKTPGSGLQGIFLDSWAVPVTVGWLVVVFCLWVGYGRGAAHKTNFEKYKSVWVVFAIVVLLAFLGAHGSYEFVETRVTGLQSKLTLLASLISGSETGLEDRVKDSTEQSVKLNKLLRNAETFDKTNLIEVQGSLRDLGGDALQVKELAGLGYSLTNELYEQERELREQGVEPKGTSVAGLAGIVKDLKETAEELQSNFQEVIAARELAAKGKEKEMLDLTNKAIEMTSICYQLQKLTEGARTALGATAANPVAPFILVSVLYLVFLVFPWALLFLFLLRNREYLVSQKARLLTELNLDKELLNRSHAVEQPNHPGENQDLITAINKLAFRNAEYVASLSIFTILTSTILYFFFFPHATSGLAQMISNGGGVETFARYLVTDSTSITFGFLGAYFFVTHMLLRRYFSGDLNPKAYTYAVVRLLTVFILGLVIQLILGRAGAAGWVASASVAAFVVGIFPNTGLRWIIRWANRLTKGLSAPEVLDRYPLTKLDGLNAWHDARLLEEKVENVQNLSTARLEDLIIHTNFSPFQLVDWMDQALLFIHSHDQWTEGFRAVGIRTATDLLATTGKPGSTKYEFAESAARELAIAINAAQLGADANPEDPREAARLAASQLSKAVNDAATAAEEALSKQKGLDKDKPETLDGIVKLRAELEALSDIARNLKDGEVKKVIEAAATLPDDGDQIKKGKAATEEIKKSADALSEKADAAKERAAQLDRKQPQTLSHLKEVKNGLDAICSEAANLKAQTGEAKTIAQTGKDGETAKEAWTALFEAIKAAEGTITTTLEKAQNVRETAGDLKPEKPETLDNVKGLQADLTKLHKRSPVVRTRIKEARDALEGLGVPPTAAAQVRALLDAAAESSKLLVTAATNAMDAAAPIDIDVPSTIAGLSQAKEAIAKAAESAAEAKKRGQAAAGAIQTASAPSQMTWEIIHALAGTIEWDPNVKRLQTFWDREGVKSDVLVAIQPKPHE